MKIKVGRTVNIVCSRSSVWPERSGTPPCTRAILVASGSFAGEPHPEQKRTPGVMYVPQLEQCILINCLLLMGRFWGLLRSLTRRLRRCRYWGLFRIFDHGLCSFYRQSSVLPGHKPSQQGYCIFDTFSFKIDHRTGGRMFVWSRTVGHYQLILRQLVAAFH